MRSAARNASAGRERGLPGHGRRGIIRPMAVRQDTIEVRVRYAEVDSFGYLHHSRYFIFFEMGRTELLRRCGIAYRDMEQRGLFYVVASLQCKYRAPARYDDVLQLTTSTERLTPVRVDHTYELRRAGTLLAEASSTLVLVGRDGRPTGLPDDLYQALTGAGVSSDAS